MEAARALLSAVSKSVEGKVAAAGGRGECRRRESSSVGTVDHTSTKSDSRRERSMLASAGTAWLPTKARAFDPDERILLKLACAEGWRALQNPETVDSHQSSQDIVSPMPARADSRPVSTAYCMGDESDDACGRLASPWSVKLGSGALHRVPIVKGRLCGKTVYVASWGMG